MSSESPIRPPSLFLSHAHEDKAFVHHLARDLTSAGVKVWVDEAEMDVGDSLLDKITFAISDMDYLGVVISAYSADSEWVTREVEVAMREEIAGKHVKVVPLLLRGGVLPPMLTGKLFADFTSEPLYPSSLQRLLSRLGIEKTPPSIAADRLSELTSSSGLLKAALAELHGASSLQRLLSRLGIEKTPPSIAADRLSELTSSSGLLRTALAELRGKGLSNSTAEALVSSKVADIELSEFLNLAAEETSGSTQLFGLAISLVQYIDERGVGHQALDFCLRSGRLEDRLVESVGRQMQTVKSTAAVLWCHSRMVSVIRSDAYYHSFLQRHIDLVADQCYDEMAAYLLQPDRGPGNYNLDSFELVIGHVENPAPFQNRVFDWIREKCFDLQGADRVEGWESPDVLYAMLNDHWGQARFDKIARAIQNHVRHLMKPVRDWSAEEGLLLHRSVREGMFHLIAMVGKHYRGAEQVLDEILPLFYDAPLEELPVMVRIAEALRAVADYNRDPPNSGSEGMGMAIIRFSMIARDLRKALDAIH